MLAKAWEFLCTKAHSNAPVIPRVILLGAPGSGRTSQAQLLAGKYGVVHVNADSLVRRHMGSDSKLGLALKPYQGREGMIPDTLLTRVISERLWEHDALTKGWVLDGFPSTRAQAEALAKAGFEASHAIFLEAPDDSLVERLSLRRVDPVTGKLYHLLYAPPASLDIQTRLKMVSPVCEPFTISTISTHTHTHIHTYAHSTSQNPKDKEDEVKRRIGGYRGVSSEVQMCLRSIAHTVNADAELQTVFEAIEAAMVTPTTQNPVPR